MAIPEYQINKIFEEDPKIKEWQKAGDFQRVFNALPALCVSVFNSPYYTSEFTLHYLLRTNKGKVDAFRVEKVLSTMTEIPPYMFAKMHDNKLQRSIAPMVNLQVPESVGTIGKFAFQQDELLKTADFNGVTKIGRYAFEGCPELQGVKFRGNVNFIPTGAFKNCPNLKLVQFTSNDIDRLVIAPGAFDGSDKAVLNVPSNVPIYISDADRMKMSDRIAGGTIVESINEIEDNILIESRILTETLNSTFPDWLKAIINAYNVVNTPGKNATGKWNAYFDRMTQKYGFDFLSAAEEVNTEGYSRSGKSFLDNADAMPTYRTLADGMSNWVSPLLYSKFFKSEAVREYLLQYRGIDLNNARFCAVFDHGMPKSYAKQTLMYNDLYYALKGGRGDELKSAEDYVNMLNIRYLPVWFLRNKDTNKAKIYIPGVNDFEKNFVCPPIRLHERKTDKVIDLDGVPVPVIKKVPIEDVDSLSEISNARLNSNGINTIPFHDKEGKNFGFHPEKKTANNAPARLRDENGNFIVNPTDPYDDIRFNEYGEPVVAYEIHNPERTPENVPDDFNVSVALLDLTDTNNFIHIKKVDEANARYAALHNTETPEIISHYEDKIKIVSDELDRCQNIAKGIVPDTDYEKAQFNNWKLDLNAAFKTRSSLMKELRFIKSDLIANVESESGHSLEDYISGYSDASGTVRSLKDVAATIDKLEDAAEYLLQQATTKEFD